MKDKILKIGKFDFNVEHLNIVVINDLNGGMSIYSIEHNKNIVFNYLEENNCPIPEVVTVKILAIIYDWRNFKLFQQAFVLAENLNEYMAHRNFLVNKKHPEYELLDNALLWMKQQKFKMEQDHNVRRSEQADEFRELLYNRREEQDRHNSYPTYGTQPDFNKDY
ncbi:MAG: hypothetical protein RL687_325 [Candidatus Parcubacteria bacterium]|jgi:hypothetical protein